MDVSLSTALEGLTPFPTDIEPEPFIEPVHEDEATADEEEDLTWWQWLLRKLGAWFVEAVLRPILVGAAWLIDWIRAELRYWTYEAMKAIADLTSTTEGLVVFMAFVITGAVLIPELIGKIATSKIGVVIKKMIDWTKEKVGNILNLIHFTDLAAIHEALLILWPEYREAFIPFQDALSALSEQLGQGTGYIHAWLNVGRSLSLVGTSLLGVDPEIGEMRMMEKSQDFMKRLDTKFRTYAHDPGLITGDIIDTFCIPYASEIRDTNQAQVESIREGRDYMVGLNASLNQLDSAFQGVIDSTIPELQEQMADNFRGMRQVIDQLSDWITDEIIPGFDDAIDILGDRAERIEASNAVVRAKLDNPIEIFMATNFQDEATQLATYRYIEGMVMASVRNSLDFYSQYSTMGVASFIEATRETIALTPTPEFLGYELPIGKLPTPTPGSAIKSWNVGEY